LRGGLIVVGVNNDLLAGAQLPSPGPDAAAVERGLQALQTRVFTPAGWTARSLRQRLACSRGPDVKVKPADYDQAFRDRYGRTCPFDNGRSRWPARRQRVPGQGIASDCMLCHAGSIGGRAMWAWHSDLDVHALFQEMTYASGIKKNPHSLQQCPRHLEAGGMAVFLLSLRDPDLKMLASALTRIARRSVRRGGTARVVALEEEKTMYYTGNSNAASVRR